MLYLINLEKKREYFIPTVFSINNNSYNMEMVYEGELFSAFLNFQRIQEEDYKKVPQLASKIAQSVIATNPDIEKSPVNMEKIVAPAIQKFKERNPLTALRNQENLLNLFILLSGIETDFCEAALSKITKRKEQLKSNRTGRPLYLNQGKMNDFFLLQQYFINMEQEDILKTKECFQCLLSIMDLSNSCIPPVILGGEIVNFFDRSMIQKETAKESFENFIKYFNMKQKNTPENFMNCNTIFEIETIEELSACTLKFIIDNNLPVKTCKNCGCPFVAYNRIDTLYCDRPSPQQPEKTCKEYGSNQAWLDKLKSNEAMKLHRNIYMAKQMLAKRNPDVKEYQRAFDYFKTESKQWKKTVKDGTKTETEFIEWLNQQKERRVIHNGNHNPADK